MATEIAGGSRQLRRLGTIGWWLAVVESVIAISLVVNHYGPDTELKQQTNALFAGAQYVEIQHPRFVAHSLLSALHFLPGIAFAVIAPLQFHAGIRAKYPRFHRWCGRIFAVTGMALGLTAIGFALKIPYGGFSELPPQILYASILCFSIARGVYLIRKGDVLRHREWMLRAASVGLGISLARVFYVAFLHGSDATSQEFFATVLWVGSGLNLMVGEIWINLSRPLRIGGAVRVSRAALRGESAPLAAE